MATNSYIPKTSETNISKRVNNKKKSSSYIPKTSETNVSTGTSSQSTPTSSQEATRLNQLRSITSSSSGGRNGSTSSSSVSSSTQSSNQESLREQYIEGSKNNNIKPPVSEQSQKISLSPSSSTTQRIARQQLEQSTTSVSNLRGKEMVVDKPLTASTITDKGYVPRDTTRPENFFNAATEEESKALLKAKRNEKIDITASEILDFDRNPDVDTLKGVPLLLGRTGFNFGKGVVGAFNVYKISEGLVTTGAGVVTGEISGTDIYEGATQSFIDNPSETVGNIVGPAVVAKGLGAAARLKVRTGEYVSPEDLFKADQLKSLSEGTRPTFPKTGSSAETISKFQKAELIAQTSSPSSVKGGKAGVGNKASFGLEDPGIYTTPSGEGSVAFLRLAGDSSEISFSLVPKKGLLDVPTVTRFKASGIETLPPSVSKVPGFKEVAVFQEAQAGSGKLFVTKRSQLGQGEIPKQTYISEMDFTLGNKKVKAGNKIMEAGTSELEAVVPLGQKFIQVTPDKFTKVGGKTVRVRDVELVVETPGGKLTTSSGKNIKPSDKIISGEQINYEQSSMVSSVKNKININPYSSVPKVTSNSLTGVSNGGMSTSVLTTSSFSGGGSSSSNFRPSSSVPDNVPSSRPIDSLRDYNISSGGSSRGSSKPYVPPPSSPSIPSSPSNPISFGGSSTPSITVSKTPYGGSSRGNSKPSSIQSGFPRSTYFKSKDKEEKQNYIVQVRRKGLFQPIFSTTNRDVAFRLGESEIKGRSSASFKVLKNNVALTPDRSFSQLYKSKREKGVLIEKRQFRINSPGEKSEITLKGIFSSKKKNKGFSFF